MRSDTDRHAVSFCGAEIFQKLNGMMVAYFSDCTNSVKIQSEMAHNSLF